MAFEESFILQPNHSLPVNGTVQSNGTKPRLDVPAFPDDVPTAPLVCLSLKKLQDWDPEESKQFFRSSKELGFFYLDLRDSSEGQVILKQADQLFDLGERLFEEDLTAYDFSEQNSYFGYKGYGKGKIDKDGTRDRNEFFNVSKDDILSISPPLPAPAPISSSRALLHSYIHSAHSILTLLLSHLTFHLQLPKSTLESLHRLSAPSGDQIRFVKAPPQPSSDRRTALGAHTDFGTLTLLFNRLGGLQVLPPETDDWLFVQPLPNHAIVNLGDALSKFSNRLLRSNIHRVVAPPGEQAECTRYSVVYFSRPEDEVLLRRLESPVIPKLMDEEKEEKVDAKTWVLRRAFGRRVGTNNKDFEGTERGRL